MTFSGFKKSKGSKFKQQECKPRVDVSWKVVISPPFSRDFNEEQSQS